MFNILPNGNVNFSYKKLSNVGKGYNEHDCATMTNIKDITQKYDRKIDILQGQIDEMYEILKTNGKINDQE